MPAIPCIIPLAGNFPNKHITLFARGILCHIFVLQWFDIRCHIFFATLGFRSFPRPRPNSNIPLRYLFHSAGPAVLVHDGAATERGGFRHTFSTIPTHRASTFINQCSPSFSLSLISKVVDCPSACFRPVCPNMMVPPLPLQCI